MWPLTPPMRVWIDRTLRDSLSCGDVAVFVREDGQLVCHRYHGTRGDALVFRGDTNRATDVLVPPGAVVGRVVSVDLGVGTRRWRLDGRRAPVLRRLGVAWSAVAPPLRATFGGLSRPLRRAIGRRMAPRRARRAVVDRLC